MKKISSRNYLQGLRVHFLPILVWLGVVACVVVLLFHRSERFEVLGIAQGRVRQIAATCTGRLKSVHVQLFDKVNLGDIVAVIDIVLDNEDLQSQLDTITAQINHLMAQLGPIQDTLLAEKADRQANQIADKRRYAVDIESARLEILRTNALIASDQILLEDLASEVKITKDLLEKKAVVPYELEKIQVRHNALAKKIKENQNLFEQAKTNLQQNLQRSDEYDQHQLYHPSVDKALDVIRKAIKVQEQLMNEILVKREPLELKSPVSGVVIPIQTQANQFRLQRPGEDIFRRPGEVVVSGQPICAIAQDEPSEIIAYVSGNQLGQVWKGMIVQLIKNRKPEQIAKAHVTYLGPTVELMPERLWRNPNIPQWGRPVLIEMPVGLKLVPGELVGIRGL